MNVKIEKQILKVDKKNSLLIEKKIQFGYNNNIIASKNRFKSVCITNLFLIEHV